jgi:hypothetical protein
VRCEALPSEAFHYIISLTGAMTAKEGVRREA